MMKAQMRYTSSPQQLTLWQKALAVFALIGSIIVAALLSFVVLYILAFLVIVALIAGSIFYIRMRFFPPRGRKKTQQRGPEGIRITETREGIIIDVDAENSKK